MKFVSVRDFRTRSASIWQQLASRQDLVITNHGKPIAIVSATDEDTVEQSLGQIRQARALRAAGQLQEQSAAARQDKLTSRDIDKEIAAVRQGHRK